jgi:C1A family cysteine protease
MKRILWAIFFVAVCASVATAASTVQSYSSLNADSTITLDHDTVAGIELWSNPSTGHSWQAKSPLGDNIRILGSKYEPSQPGLIGGGGVTTIYVVGADPGTTDLVLEYRRAHSKDTTDSIRYNFRTAATFTETFTVPSPAEAPPMAESQTETSADLGLPSSFNWCDQNGCTPIKNQGSCGSCWAFSTVATFESVININDGDTVDLSEQYLLSCNDDGWSCDGGWWAHDYHQSKKVSGQTEAGAVLESDYPYEGQDTSCGPDYPKAYNIDSWHYVCGSESCTPTTDQIKQAIYDHGAVSVAVCSETMSSYSGGIFTDSCSNLDHAVNLVGWDDDGGYWIMRNSWGTNWGESGYMRIKYGVSGIGSNANYVVYGDNTDPDTDPDPDPEPEPEPTDQCVTDNNNVHISQGRAYQCGSFNQMACAVGSEDNLGFALDFYAETTSIQETAPDYWERVESCP